MDQPTEPPTIEPSAPAPAMGPAPGAVRAPDPTLLERVRAHEGLVAVLVAALVVRASGLGQWWLNPDEGIYYSILTRSTFGGFWSEVAANAHPPLFYLLLRGLGLFTWDFLWFRLFSLVCGLAAVIGVWAVARELGGRGERGSVAGLVAGLIVAFAPGAVELSQVIRPYMLQLAALSGALLFLLRYLRAPSTRDLVLYVVLVALALLTHYSSVLALGAFGLLVLHHGFWGGVRRPEWVRLALVHVAPALLLVGVYFLHLRPLMGSALADEALDGWLSYYMVHGPADVWLGLVGFQDLIAPEWLRGPAVVLLLGAVAASLLARDPRPALVVGTGFALAVLGAAAGIYPLGATRHTIWLAAFTVPALGWLAAFLLDLPRGHARGALALAALLVALGGPVGRALGTERAPWAPSDRVLTRSELGQMVDLLEPTAEPRLVLMSAQTFYLLLPFYPSEREAAVFSPDSSVFHFPLGRRHVLVAQAWDFTAGPDASDPRHLSRALATARAAFPELGLEQAGRAVLLVGGWRPAFVDELTARSATDPFIVSTRSVRGLYAFLVDLPALRGAFEVPGGGPEPTPAG